MRAAAAVFLCAFVLQGCAGLTPVENQVWVRMDGQSGKTNPALAAAFEADRTACRIAGQINQVCMTQKGYVLVPESQAEAKAAEFRAAGAMMPPNPAE